ncbi:uncharacterized protein [Dendrobates tinctorius]|uniref:uncharacterized protein isoform X2 n=1 Tax=Dendrobates tinctorius TaxID=92724 RepID=UPI003CCA05CC
MERACVSETVNKVRTRWRSMKDRFNKDQRQEIQVRSGAVARIRKYKYHRMLAFLRPALAQSTTLEPGLSSGAAPHRTATEQFQSSISDAASGPASQAGVQAAGPSGVPLSQASATGFYESSRQRQKALDRPLMPEFIHLSSVLQNGLKSIGDKLESGLAHINTLFQDVNRCLDHLEADLRRPAQHFFHTIEWGMSEHLTPELQLNVMQACNAAYVQAMQQTRYFQQPHVAFPPVPPLSRFSSLLSSSAYHCTATTMPSPAAHHYTTTTMPGAAELHSTTMLSPAPVRPSTATTIPGEDPARLSTATTMPGQDHARLSTTTTMPGPDPARPSTSSAEPTTPTLPWRHRHKRSQQPKTKKKRQTVQLPLPTPPNVSVLSSLSLPSNVSLSVPCFHS